MATLGWIKFGVACDTTQFAKGTQQAAAETQHFGNQLKQIAGAYFGFEALKMGTERIKEYVTSAIEGVSSSKILAERVGMSSESFARLGYSAKLAHMDQDQFAVSLEQMNKRLAEVAIEGSGPAGDALARFGVKARDLTTMGTEDAFFKIVDVMQQIKNPAERAAFAMDVFGKAGQGIINVAARGTEAIKGQGDEAARLGIALNQVGTEKVEEASQAFIKLQAAGQGFANLLVEKLSPYIVAVIDKYMEWGYAGTKSADFVKKGADLVISGIGLIGDSVIFVEGTYHSMQGTAINAFGAIVGAIDVGVKGMEWFANAGLAAFRTVEGMAADAVGGIGNLFKGMFEGLNAGWNMLVDSFASGLDFILRPLRDLSKKLGLTTTNIDQDIKGLRDLPKSLDFSGAFDGMSKAMKESIGDGKAELTDFFGVWAQDIGKLGGDQAKAADAIFGHLGEGSAKLRGMMADIEKGAQDRAGAEVKKSNLFNAAGDMHKKEEKPAFSGAVEFGSKDAYSSVVRNTIGRNEQTEQRRIAGNTQRTAGAAERTVALLEKIAGVAGKEFSLVPANPAAF